ncbi:energy-coupling factor transporter transmembrane component T family protein [Thermofilum pendens]|uniref:Cobalt transport protein n=1 Tax=Thermofilum pendens (strain DSM 2475 / Hrk 5) TaxID=368408 RepID=A1RZ73_THEPD|nr:energy-coupling factor transporter transmembrane component T [Thermofilum pendens]ABL78503.1 cobalt transport protein [Thermofilum pendens Hrk 5]
MPTILGELTGFEAESKLYMGLSPLVKIVVPLSFSLDVLLVKDVPSAAALTLAVFLVVLAVKVPLRVVKGFLVLIASLSAFIVLSLTLFTSLPGRVLFEYTLLSVKAEKGVLAWRIVVTDEALSRSFFFVLRILAMILTATLFVATVSDRDVVRALRGLRLPLGVAVAASLFFRGISMFLDDFRVIREAMMARGVDFEKTSLYRRFFLYVNALIPLISLMVSRSYEVSLALESKGLSPLSGPRGGYAFALTRADRLVLGLAALQFALLAAWWVCA